MNTNTTDRPARRVTVWQGIGSSCFVRSRVLAPTHVAPVGVVNRHSHNLDALVGGRGLNGVDSTKSAVDRLPACPSSKASESLSQVTSLTCEQLGQVAHFSQFRYRRETDQRSIGAPSRWWSGVGAERVRPSRSHPARIQLPRSPCSARHAPGVCQSCAQHDAARRALGALYWRR